MLKRKWAPCPGGSAKKRPNRPCSPGCRGWSQWWTALQRSFWSFPRWDGDSLATGQLVSLVSAGRGSLEFLFGAGRARVAGAISPVLCARPFWGKACDPCFIVKRANFGIRPLPKSWILSLASLSQSLHFSEPCILSFKNINKPTSQSPSKDHMNLI